MDEERIALQRFFECVLVFESEFERMKFNDFVIYNVDVFSDRLPHFPDLEDYNMDAFKKQKLKSKILKKMLKIYRI